jgi:hypothetical protein
MAAAHGKREDKRAGKPKRVELLNRPINPNRKDLPMTLGNELDHLVDKVAEEGSAETAWLMLRNVYFKEGTPTEGWHAMTAWFASKGVLAIKERRMVKGSEVAFVCLTRKP